MGTQLARKTGAHVIGTGRAADPVFEVIGGDIGKRSAALIRPGGTLVSIVAPPAVRPIDGLAVDFVVESDRAQLTAIVQRVRDKRLDQPSPSP